VLAEPLREILAGHRLRQRETRLAAEEWDESWGGDLVFSGPSGALLNGSTVMGAFSHRLRGAGLRHCRFHGLRHGAATFWLAPGVDLKTLSTLLGHSTISTTANIYTSVLDSLKADAAARMTRLMAGVFASSPPHYRPAHNFTYTVQWKSSRSDRRRLAFR